MYNYLEAAIQRYPMLEQVKKETSKAIEVLVECFSSGNKLLICGNGGSAADSEHMAGELMKGFLKKRQLNQEDRLRFGDELSSGLQYGLPAIPLVSHISTITAVSNDLGMNMIFAQQVFALGQKGDVLIGFSTSGNSPNIVSAVRVAKGKQMTTVALTGAKTGRLSELCDICIRVPAEETFRVQELHLPIYHAICSEVENRFFEE